MLESLKKNLYFVQENFATYPEKPVLYNNGKVKFLMFLEKQES